MRLADGGCIEFESRREVDHISAALQEWLKRNPDNAKTEDVKVMIDKLETLYMCW